MVDSVTYNATKDERNMSGVSIEQELAVICSNQSTAQSEACDRSAQGISLSTPILMMALGVFGNVLALLVLYSSRREAQARRTVFFVMLSGLAWTDLICQFSVSPIAIIIYANNLKWVGGVPLCLYHGFVMVSFALIMPLIVCCMSVERFLAIKFSYYYARHITRRKAQLTFFTCWCVPAVFATFPFMGFGSYEHQYPGSWCFLNFHKESTMDAIYAAIFATVGIIAIAIMFICNVTVAVTLFRMRQNRQLKSSPSVDRKLSLSGIGSTTTSGTVIRARRHSDMEAQMIWFLLLITIAFSVCWLPLFVHILLMQFTGDTNNRVLDLKVIRMASCNQILDPWLYVIFRKNSLLRIIRRIKACWTTKKEPPRNFPPRGPPLRYVLGNKSFSCEPSAALKNQPHKCGDSPTFCRHVIQEVPEESRKGLYSCTSADSIARLMGVCPNCDCDQNHQLADTPDINLSPGQSPSSTPVRLSKFDFPPPLTDKDSEYQEKETTLTSLTSPKHGLLKPLLEKTGKLKKIPLRFLQSFDTFVSTDSYKGNVSSDPSHQQAANRASLLPLVTPIIPTTPTLTRAADPEDGLAETVCQTSQEPQQDSTKLLFEFSPPLATPEPDSSLESNLRNTHSDVSGPQLKDSSPAYIPLSNTIVITNSNSVLVNTNCSAPAGNTTDEAQRPLKQKPTSPKRSLSNDSDLVDDVFASDDDLFLSNHHAEPCRLQNPLKLANIKTCSSQEDSKHNGFIPGVSEQSAVPLLSSSPAVHVQTINTFESPLLKTLQGKRVTEPKGEKDSIVKLNGQSIPLLNGLNQNYLDHVKELQDGQRQTTDSMSVKDFNSGSYGCVNGSIKTTNTS